MTFTRPAKVPRTGHGCALPGEEITCSPCVFRSHAEWADSVSTTRIGGRPWHRAPLEGRRVGGSPHRDHGVAVQFKSGAARLALDTGVPVIPLQWGGAGDRNAPYSFLRSRHASGSAPVLFRGPLDLSDLIGPQGSADRRPWASDSASARRWAGVGAAEPPQRPPGIPRPAGRGGNGVQAKRAKKEARKTEETTLVTRASAPGCGGMRGQRSGACGARGAGRFLWKSSPRGVAPLPSE